jgi:hypothetical protein
VHDCGTTGGRSAGRHHDFRDNPDDKNILTYKLETDWPDLLLLTFWVARN